MVSKKHSCVNLSVPLSWQEDENNSSSSNTAKCLAAALLDTLDNSKKGNAEINVELEEDKITRASSKSKFESIRAKLKQMSLKSFEHLGPLSDKTKLSIVPTHMEVAMKSKIAESGLEEFADLLNEFEARYEIGKTVGQV